jgi:outer membrane immunogenic protein
MRRALFIAAILGCMVGAVQLAQAADMATKAPMPAKAPMAPLIIAYNWTGFYVGGHVGGGWEHHTITNSGSLGSSNFPVGYSSSDDLSGVLAGGQIGYDWQFHPNWLVGVAGDLAWTDIKGDAINVGLLNPPALSHVHHEYPWLATVTGRFGYVANNWLLYAKGGAAWAKAKSSSFTTNAAGVTTTTTESSATRTGWTVGAGTEYRFTQNWSAFLEYDYIDFGTDTISTAVTFGTTAPVLTGTTLSRDNKAYMNVVKGGINFRF